MPDLQVHIPLTHGEIEAYNKLTDSQRDLLLGSTAEEFRKYMRNQKIKDASGHRRTVLPDGTKPATVSFSEFSEADRAYLHEVAIRSNKTVVHVIRGVVCDFLLQAHDHPDRELRRSRDARTDKQQYVSMTFSVQFKDSRIRERLLNTKTKQQFYEYFSTRIKQLYEELNHAGNP